MKRALNPFAALAAVVALLVTLPACSASDEPAAAQADKPATTAATTAPPAATSNSTVEAEPGSPVDGTWHAGPFPLARVAGAMKVAGLGRWLPQIDVFATTDRDAEVVYDLKIQDGLLLMAVTVDGRPLGVIDRQAVEVHGQQVDFSTTSGCPSTFDWTTKAERLTLRLVKDTCPDVQGTPDAAYATALYASVPFERV